MGKREIIYLSLNCHHQNDFCIKVGSDGSHFNVSLIVRDKITRQRPQTTTFQVKGELTQIRTEVPPLTSPPPYREAKPAHGCGCQYWGFLTSAQTSMLSIAHRGCTNSVRESAPKADSGRNVPCCMHQGLESV